MKGRLFYDCEGNLASVSNAISGAVDSYWYDSAGRRIAKQENGSDLVLYLWDGMTIIATANAAGEITSYFTRGPGIAGDVGSLIAETRFTSGGTTSTTYLHSNWRGDVVMATDTAGGIIGEYAYTTFGEPLSQTGTHTPRFGFSSKERDASGLVYYGFRYYSPVLCRWISEDPIREAGGLNLYQFCGNDPINLIDPWGLACNGGVLDAFQSVLDGIGVFDPTGIADGINALIYLGRGQYGYAAISAMGIIPYIGDLGKAGKYGAKGARLAADATVATSSRAARRQAMRNAGTPTSRPASSQSISKTGQRQYVTEGADGKPRIQMQHAADADHPTPHWHDAAPKIIEETGVMRLNRYGQIKYEKGGASVPYQQ